MSDPKKPEDAGDPFLEVLDDLARANNVVDRDDGPDDSAARLQRPRPSVPHALADACLKAALPSDLLQRLKRRVLAVVVTVPGSDWVAPIEGAARRLVAGATIIARDGGKRLGHRSENGDGEVSDALSRGRSVIGVSQSPPQFLPSALVSAADAHVTVGSPDTWILRRILRKHARGKPPAGIPEGTAQGLSFAEIVCAFRAGATAQDVLANMVRAADSKAGPAGAGPDDIPPLDCLSDDLRRLAGDIISGVGDYRAGRINKWSDIATTRALLAGSPGVGKTKFAAVLAKAMGVPLIVDSCGQFFARAGDSGYLGTIAASLQGAFDAARVARPGPCILCLDEFDAICPERALLDRRNKDFWVTLVTLCLVLIESTEGVILLATTNNADSIDRAATRPKRLRRIDVAPIDPGTLTRILRWHLKGALENATDDDIASVTRLVPDATPAMAAQWALDVLQAARNAGRDPSIEDLLTVVAPPDRRSPDDLRIAAVHEAGHAVAYLAFGRAIAAVSIVARGGSGGLTRARGPVSKLPRRGDIDDIIVTLLAGRAAEKAILGDASAGAEGDLAQATTILVEAHATQGLGDTLIHRADFSSLLAYDRVLRDAVEADLQRLYARALTLIRRRRAAVGRIADALVARRFLTGDDVTALITPSRARASRPRIRGRNP